MNRAPTSVRPAANLIGQGRDAVARVSWARVMVTWGRRWTGSDTFSMPNEV